MRTAVVFLCLGLVSATGRSSPNELITRFSEVLPGAFPNGLKDNIDSAKKLVSDVTNDLSGGNTQVTKEELDEARRIIKLTVVAQIAQKKHDTGDLMDEDEFMKATEAEVNAAEKNVDSMLDNLLKTGVVTIVERQAVQQGSQYAHMKAAADKKAGDQMTSGLVSASHKMHEEKDKEESPENMNLLKEYGLEAAAGFKAVERTPSFNLVQKKNKEQRELKAMARRWRQDPRPTGRVSSGDVLQNKEEVVDEIFKAYDHDRDDSLSLEEFNELQADTDGPDSVNTAEEFNELLEQVGEKNKHRGLNWLTFHKLYLDPWMSEKFETILPVDYHALLEAGKIKGESLAEIWKEEDESAEEEKVMAPLLEQDRKDAEKQMEEAIALAEKEGRVTDA